MAGQRQKDPSLLVNRRGGRGTTFDVVVNPDRVAPKPPPGLTIYSRRVWRDFWSSWVSDAVDMEAHGERLRHWIRCVDERARLWPLVVQEPLVLGSKGQPVLNPLVARIRELTRDIERAEDSYGMTPLAKFRMALTATDAQRSANDLRRELVEQVADVIDLDALE
jgi:hypothetical protein